MFTVSCSLETYILFLPFLCCLKGGLPSGIQVAGAPLPQINSRAIQCRVLQMRCGTSSGENDLGQSRMLKVPPDDTRGFQTCISRYLGNYVVLGMESKLAKYKTCALNFTVSIQDLIFKNPISLYILSNI